MVFFRIVLCQRKNGNNIPKEYQEFLKDLKEEKKYESGGVSKEIVLFIKRSSRRREARKEQKQDRRWHMKGRRNRNIILMILILVFVGSWLIPGIFGIVIGIVAGVFGGFAGLFFCGLGLVGQESIRCLQQRHMVCCLWVVDF